jgi:hypothetical protein
MKEESKGIQIKKKLIGNSVTVTREDEEKSTNRYKRTRVFRFCYK